MPNALAIRHVCFEDLGLLEPILQKHGFDITYLEASTGDFTQRNPENFNLIVILGGPIGVYDSQDYPFLIEEVNFIKQAINKNIPMIGLCLGSQLLAQCLGATVYPGPEKEIGWYPLQLTEAGKNSILQDLDNQYVLHWHGDTFSIPEQANHLASSQAYPNQAFQYKNILALQFHIEVTFDNIQQWLVGHTSEIHSTQRLSVSLLRKQTEQYIEIIAPIAEKIFEKFLNDYSL